MNISKFTQKSVQAVQDLEKVAYEYGNQEIEQEHLLYTLLTQEDSLILKLIEKMEINKDYFENKGYNVYFTGARFTYKNSLMMVQNNQFMIAVKEDI